jgi:hypothetical protein
MKRKNNKLFRVGSAESVDMDTGESVPIEGGGFMMLPGPPGTCEWCHVKHDADEPHDQQSVPYQMKFQTLHGRPPTWSDAMAHCSAKTRKHWRRELVAQMQRHEMEIPADLLEG